MRLRPLTTRKITLAVAALVAARFLYIHFPPSGVVGAQVSTSTAKPSEEQKVGAGGTVRLLKNDPVLAAIALSDRGRLEEAEEALTDLIRAEDGAMARNGRGVVYFRMKNLDRALKDFDQAIALSPKAPDAYSNRATVRLVQGDKEGALADYGKVIALKPEGPGQLAFALRNRAGILADLKRHDEALADLQDALKAAPKDWKDRKAVTQEADRIRRLLGESGGKK